MARIHYVQHDGTEHVVEVEPGLSVMEGAGKNGVPGIDADCGGACACATCHVFIDEGWISRVGRAESEQEVSMLELAPTFEANSRLSCQIEVGEELDGLIVRMPESQH